MKKILTTIICISVAHLFGCSDNYYYYNTNCNEGGNNAGDFETSISSTGGSDAMTSVSSTSSGSSIPDSECSVAADCGEAQNFCQQYSCHQNQCVLGTKPAGTLVPDQVSGDCKKSVCAGNKILDTVDDTDISSNSCLSCNFGDLINNCSEEIKCRINGIDLYTCPLTKIDWWNIGDEITETPNHCDPNVRLSPGTSCPVGNMCRVITPTVSYIGVCE